MSNLSEIVYSPLMEEAESLKGWSKSTIDYALANEDRVCASIRGTSKYYGKTLTYQEVEDVYEEVIQYLYNAEDYNLNKACSQKCGDSLVSLAGYVNTCTKFITLRYIKKIFKSEEHIVKDTIVKVGTKDMCLLDIKPDNRDTDLMNSIAETLEDTCEAYQHERYRYGADIFTLWYVRLKTLSCNKMDKYHSILKSIGVSKHTVNSISRGSSIMINFAKAVSMAGSTEAALETLAKFTYGVDKIDRVIEMC